MRSQQPRTLRLTERQQGQVANVKMILSNMMRGMVEKRTLTQNCVTWHLRGGDERNVGEMGEKLGGKARWSWWSTWVIQWSFHRRCLQRSSQDTTQQHASSEATQPNITVACLARVVPSNGHGEGNVAEQHAGEGEGGGWCCEGGEVVGEGGGGSCL